MRLRKVALWMGLPVLIVLGGYAVWWASLSHRFQSRLDRLREAGEPITLADLESPQVPESKNAAPLLIEAHQWFAEHEGGEPEAGIDWLARRYWMEEDWDGLEVWLKTCAPYIALLEEAAGRPECRYELDWSQGIFMEVPSIPTMQEAARALEARAALDARTHAPDAHRSLVTLMKLADHLEQHCVICVLVRGTVHGVAFDALREIARAPGFDARGVRAELEGLFAAAEDPRPRLTALRGERVFLLQVIAQWIDGESPRAITRRADAMTGDIDASKEPEGHSAADSIASTWIFRPIAYLDGIAFLDFIERSIEIASECSPESVARLEILCEETRERGLPYLFTSLFAPVPYKLLQGELRRLAQVRLARVGLALLEYRQAHREWPTALEELASLFGGAAPLDPYSGQAFRYERIEGGARLEADAPIPIEELREDDEIVWKMKG